MNGRDVETLQVLKLDEDEEPLFSLQGDQGPSWHMEQVDIPKGDRSLSTFQASPTPG